MRFPDLIVNIRAWAESSHSGITDILITSSDEPLNHVLKCLGFWILKPISKSRLQYPGV